MVRLLFSSHSRPNLPAIKKGKKKQVFTYYFGNKTWWCLK